MRAARWWILSAVLTACGGAAEPSSTVLGLQADAAWPMYRLGVDHSGQTANRGPVSPHVLWRFNPGDATSSNLSVDCPPVIAADETVYIATANHALIALAADGTAAWQVDTGASCDGSPAIAADGTVIVAAGDLHAIAPDGVTRWSYHPPVDGLSGSPAIASDGTIYVSAHDAGLFAISADGLPRWIAPMSRGGQSSPAIGKDGTIYVGGDEKVQAFAPDGVKLWEAAVPTSEHLVPIVNADTTIAAVTADQLRVFTPGGAQVLNVGVGTLGTRFPAAVLGDTGWVLPSQNGMTLLDRNGTQAWQVPYASPSVAVVDVDGNIYLADAFCNARSYDAGGVERWAVAAAPGGSCGGPVLGARGTLYLTSPSAGLIALGD